MLVELLVVLEVLLDVEEVEVDVLVEVLVVPHSRTRSSIL